MNRLTKVGLLALLAVFCLQLVPQPADAYHRHHHRHYGRHW
ncbi:MAG: hypothetical protein P4L53_15450 [Candidatus Obscuribacterales bacterium]|nr:hypothetical protein [Candidatus Obscuribacterales bacterium]